MPGSSGGSGSGSGNPGDGETTTLALDREVALTPLLGDALTLRLLEVRFEPPAADEEEGEGGGPRCALRAEVSWETYRRILEEGAFSLIPGTRRDDGVSFDEDRPVELRLVLRPGLADVLAERGGLDAENVVVALAGDLDAPDVLQRAVRQSEAWVAHEVVQRVPLPDGMEGELRTGYRTAWADRLEADVAAPEAQEAQDTEDAPDDEEAEGAEEGVDESLAETVERFLGERGWRHERLNERLFKMGIRGKSGNWTLLIAVDEGREVVMVYSILPQNVPEERRAEVATFLVDTNYQLFVGGFEMDMEDGEVRFRTSLDVENDRLSDALLASLLDTNVTLMDGHTEELDALLAGRDPAGER